MVHGQYKGKMSNAIWRMASGNKGSNKRYKITSRTYIFLREEHSKNMKGKPSPTKGLKHSIETRRKNSEAHKGLQAGERNGMFNKTHSDDSKKKMSNDRKNREKHICPHCCITTEIGNYSRWHGDKCKMINQTESIKCPHCDVEGKMPGIKVWHFDNCRWSKRKGK
jgi:hypothetical protein